MMVDCLGRGVDSIAQQCTAGTDGDARPQSNGAHRLSTVAAGAPPLLEACHRGGGRLRGQEQLQPGSSVAVDARTLARCSRTSGSRDRGG
jgi:hypothetical protein